jgi:hypothetical protein
MYVGTSLIPMVILIERVVVGQSDRLLRAVVPVSTSRTPFFLCRSHASFSSSAIWTAPIQITVCLIILLVQLGPSALAGFALFLLVIPFQERVMGIQFAVRQKSMKWTDKRAKIIQELLGGMRIIKYFTYEIPFIKRELLSDASSLFMGD